MFFYYYKIIILLILSITKKVGIIIYKTSQNFEINEKTSFLT